MSVCERASHLVNYIFSSYYVHLLVYFFPFWFLGRDFIANRTSSWSLFAVYF